MISIFVFPPLRREAPPRWIKTLEQRHRRKHTARREILGSSCGAELYGPAGDLAGTLHYGSTPGGRVNNEAGVYVGVCYAIASVRSRSTTVRGGSFDSATIEAVWNKGQVVSGYVSYSAMPAER